MLGNVCVLVIWVSRPYIAQTLAFSVSFSQIINLALSAVYMPGQTVYSVRWMPIRNNFQGISQHVRLLKCAVIRSFPTQGPASAKHSSMTWGHGTASETCQLLWNTGRCVKLHIYMPIKDRVSDLNNLWNIYIYKDLQWIQHALNWGLTHQWAMSQLLVVQAPLSVGEG